MENLSWSTADWFGFGLLFFFCSERLRLHIKICISLHQCTTNMYALPHNMQKIYSTRCEIRHSTTQTFVLLGLISHTTICSAKAAIFKTPLDLSSTANHDSESPHEAGGWINCCVLLNAGRHMATKILWVWLLLKLTTSIISISYGSGISHLSGSY